MFVLWWSMHVWSIMGGLAQRETKYSDGKSRYVDSQRISRSWPTAALVISTIIIPLTKTWQWRLTAWSHYFNQCQLSLMTFRCISSQVKSSQVKSSQVKDMFIDTTWYNNTIASLPWINWQTNITENYMISIYVVSKGAETPGSLWAPLLFQRILYPGKKRCKKTKTKKDKQKTSP